MKKSFPYLVLCLAALLFLAQPAEAQTTVLFESFENTEMFTNNWVVESDFPDDEEAALWGVVGRIFGGNNEIPRTGTNKLYCAAVRPDGTRAYLGTFDVPYYPDNMSTFMTREVDLQKYSKATLTFWFKAKIFPGNEDEFEEYTTDYMTVLVNDEQQFSTDEITEPVTGWRKVTVNLDQFAGSICTLKLAFESDFYGQEDRVAAGEGVYVDDILVTGYTAYRPDYNKDGWTDFLFHNLNDGRLAIWHMANYTQMQQSTLVRDGISRPREWRVACQSDFNNDGNADILWHHNDGRLNVWLMNGGNLIESSLIRSIGSGWRMMATADFNNDGSQDFVWQHTDRRVAIWYMDGANYISSGLINKLQDGGANIVGAGDFNYDGRRDLLQQRKTTGKISTRLLSGVNVVFDYAFTYAPGLTYSPEWRVAGTHDMNGDGDPDLLMRHLNGELAAWILDGAHVVQQIPIRNAGVQWTNAGHR